MKKLNILVTCVGTKTIPTEFYYTDYEGDAAGWLKDISHSTTKIKALDLYGGPGFKQVRRLKEKYDLTVWVISAGYGLVREDDLLAGYEASFSPSAKPNHVRKADYTDWLPAVSLRKPEELPDNTIIALPKSYEKALATLIDLDKFDIIQGGAAEREILGCSMIRLQNTYLEYYLETGKKL